jgi:small subunit ribosomal protein S17
MENTSAQNASAAPAKTPSSHAARGRKQEKTGLVTSAKMAKTIVVKVTRMVGHKKYGRIVRVTKKFYAHDETGQAKTGDTVRIVETRPMSKLKRWRLAEVIAHRAGAVQRSV